MGVKNIISNGGPDDKSAHVVERYENPAGLHVYTSDFQEYNSRIIFATNDIHGSDLAQNAAFGGTPEHIHNGGDSTYWTGVQESGTWNFADTAQSNNGSASINGSGANNNQSARFDKGSDLTIANYTAITGFIRIDNWATGGTLKEIEVELLDGGVVVSDIINLSSYINNSTFDVWQSFVIPLSDFNVSGSVIDSIRFRNRDIGGGAAPNYWLDDLRFEETGSTLEYIIAPDPNETYLIDTFSYFFADAYAGVVTNGTMPSIPYNGFLDVSELTNGILIQRFEAGEVVVNAARRNLFEFMISPDLELNSFGSDGTNTWLKLKSEVSPPLRLDGATGDKITYTVQDDLSGLLEFRISVKALIKKDG